jgi:hypothetical protein
VLGDDDFDIEQDIPLVEGFVSGSLAGIWEERKVTPPNSEVKIILEEVVGENDKCALILSILRR